MLAGMLAAVVSLAVAGAGPALASGPPNGTIGTATVVTSLPFHDTEDMSQASFPPPDVSSCGGNTAAVWYKFTPVTSERIVFDPGTSTTLIAIDVFTGSPTALTPVGCATGCNCGDELPSGFIMDATADTTYWIMASTADNFGPPLTLGLWIYPDVPPQATLSVTGGTVDRGGNVTVTGVFDCTGTVPGGAPLVGTIRQPVTRLHSTTARFATTVPCGPAQPWTALAQPHQGKFVPGHGDATIDVAPPHTFSICNLAGCIDPTAAKVVKLKSGI